MSTGRVPSVSEVLPNAAWDMLEQEKSSVLIDVRTSAEWGFVGVPDLEELGKRAVFVEWASFPDMSKNPHFVAAVKEAIGGSYPAKMLFLCRSGARSLHAAYAVADALSADGVSADCINVAEGFEGDLNSRGRRGQLNGWKAKGLAWRQS